MSSRSGKGKGKATGGSIQWSGWAWDATGYQWYRTYEDLNGQYHYEYRAPDTIPRSETDSNPAKYVNTASTLDTTYNESREYTLQGSTQSSGSVSALTDRFATTSLSDQRTSTYTVAYDEPNPSSRYVSSSGTHSYGGTQPSMLTTSGGYTSSSLPRGSVNPYGGNVSSTVSTIAENSSSYYPSQTYGGNTMATSNMYGGGPGAYPMNSSVPYQTTAGPSTNVTLQSPPPRITGTKGKRESLDPNFKVHHSRFFERFHVFKVLWPEPQGSTGKGTLVTEEDYIVQQGSYGEKIHCSIRRFVIITSSHGHCSVVPILTYGHQGTRKPGINPHDHAIIYTGSQAPQELEHELPLQNGPIQVIPKTPRDKLSGDSRVNYAKIYTVEHNVKVLFIGQIAESCRRRFLLDYDATQARRRA